MSNKSTKSSMKSKLSAVCWGLKLAWKVDKRMLLLWGLLSMLISILPAVAISLNREVLSILSGFIAGGNYQFTDAVLSITLLGIMLTLTGLSARINGDLIYMMMFDSYYFGMMDILTDVIHGASLETLLKKEIKDEYYYSVYRVGSLTDLASGLCDIMGKLVSVVSLLVVAATVSKAVFILVLVYIGIVFIINFKFTNKTRHDSLMTRNSVRKINYYTNLSDRAGVSKEIRVFGNSGHIIRQWENHYDKLMGAERQRGQSRETARFISGIGFYVFLIIIISISLFGIAQGTMTPDVFLVIFSLCMSIFTVSSSMAVSIQSFDYGLFALERQKYFFNLVRVQEEKSEDEKYQTVNDETIIFDAKNLSFEYEAGRKVIDDVSFQVVKGDVIALIGQNGSGKTTLVKLLANMFQPTKGSLHFFGHPIGKCKKSFIRSKIGIFFQDFFLFHLTLRENVGLGNVKEINSTERIRTAIEKGGAKKLLSKLPDGLNTMVNRNVDKNGKIFSGGEKQRIGSARTHMSDKEILIFDEPASMLDPVAEMEQFMGIKELLDGRTAILISHRIGFARLAKKIILMDEGKIVEMGEHEELMARQGLYFKLFQEQAKWYDQDKAAEVRG